LLSVRDLWLYQKQ